MAEAKLKEGEFDEWLLGDMYDELKGHSFALEALAELITSASLEEFSEETSGKHKSANLRWGLSQIFGLYFERQQKTLESYLNKFNNLDLSLINRGKNLLELVSCGSYNNDERANEMLNEAIGYLDVVIGRESEYKDVAEGVKGECLGRLRA